MNLKTDILKSYTTIFNAENYTRALAYETQKPKNPTYLYLNVENVSFLEKRTGSNVYSIDLSFTFYTNSQIKLNDEIDKINNILAKYHNYRETNTTYFYNALIQGVEFGTDEDEFKFKITITLTHEEVE